MQANTYSTAPTHSPLRQELRRVLFEVVNLGELLLSHRPGAANAEAPYLDALLLRCAYTLTQLNASMPIEARTFRDDHDCLSQEIIEPPFNQQLLKAVQSLCAVADEYAAVEEESADSTHPVQDPRVLLAVDDDPANCEVLARRLRREGHTVLTAESGPHALRMLSRYGIDLVLLDLQMPGMSGIETLKELRGKPALAQLPVIMVTAEDEVDVIAACITNGADDYLIKPPNPVLLKARVNALLGRKHLQDEQHRQRRELEKASAAAIEQAEKMERLLEHILPRSIAMELQQSGSVQPMYFEDVSIVFADIVGFTLSTENLPADDLVESLNEYFTACDRIMELYGLEKLKTIGDSYMFAGGIPQHNSAHPVDSIFASFDMIDALRRISMAHGMPWKLRVGMHIGPVIAGVVGIHKFAFDIWGEAVNYTSRMESCGEPDRINLSAAAFLRVKDFFACDKREQVRTKDGRTCDMYFVRDIAEGLRNKPPLTPSAAFQTRYAKYFRKSLDRLPDALFREDTPTKL